MGVYSMRAAPCPGGVRGVTWRARAADRATVTGGARRRDEHVRACQAGGGDEAPPSPIRAGGRGRPTTSRGVADSDPGGFRAGDGRPGMGEQGPAVRGGGSGWCCGSGWSAGGTRRCWCGSWSGRTPATTRTTPA